MTDSLRIAMTDSLVIDGGAVKALGDGKVGGYLIRFGTASDTDLEGDYFTKNTDFGVEWADDGTGGKSAVLYHHGLDASLKTRKLTESPASLKMDDAGIWIESQMALRDDYERALYGMAQKGKLGWSSGTAAHLVARKSAGSGASEILSWPLGLDASMTPAPAEPRNAAMPLKAWAKAVSRKSIDAGIRESLTFAAVTRLQDALWSEIYDAVYNGGDEGSLADLSQDFDDLRDLAIEVIEALIGGKADETPAEAAKSIKKLLPRMAAESIKTERDFERHLRDAGYSRTQAAAITGGGFKALSQRDAGDEAIDDADLVASLKAAAAALA